MTTNTYKPSKPDMQVDTYGVRNVPEAAKFGVGAQTLAEIKDAADARMAQRPGDYYQTPTAKD